MDYSQQQVIESLQRHLRPAVLAGYNYVPGTCIPTTRVGIDVLAAFGIKAVPVSAAAEILNERGMALRETVLNEHGNLHSPAARAAMRAADRRALYCELGYWHTARSMGWDMDGGHVVIAIPQAGLVYDGSLDQVYAPQHDIQLAPTMFDIGQELLAYWRATHNAGFIRLVDTPHGAVELNYIHTAERPYLTSEWFRRNGHNQRIAGQVIRAIRADIAALATV